MAIKAKSLEARPVDIKSGWKHNSKALGEIVTAMNDEEFVPDENAMMEVLDSLLAHVGKRYDIVERGKI